MTQLLPLVRAVPPIRGKRGAPKRKPALVQADRTYDSDPLRELLAEHGIDTQIARRRAPHGSGLGKTRWVVERTIAWLHQFRRLRVRYERLPSIHEALLKPFFILAALYDAILGIAFLFFSAAIFQAFGVTPPNHLAYVQFPALLLLVFAAMFYRVATDPVRNRELILYGIVASTLGPGGAALRPWQKDEG